MINANVLSFPTQNKFTYSTINKSWPTICICKQKCLFLQYG